MLHDHDAILLHKLHLVLLQLVLLSQGLPVHTVWTLELHTVLNVVVPESLLRHGLQAQLLSQNLRPPFQAQVGHSLKSLGRHNVMNLIPHQCLFATRELFRRMMKPQFLHRIMIPSWVHILTPVLMKTSLGRCQAVLSEFRLPNRKKMTRACISSDISCLSLRPSSATRIF